MESIDTFKEALFYETKIRDLYKKAVDIIDDERGKKIFSALADDEQSHIDFLEYSLDQLERDEQIDRSRLTTPIPSLAEIEKHLDRLQATIPEHMLGDIKKVLGNALVLEKETSSFYQAAYQKTTGEIREIFKDFLEIEMRHVDVVQTELDHASNNGIWFDFMEIDLEAY